MTGRHPKPAQRGDVRIAVRAQAFDGAAQSIRRQPADDRLERGRRAGMRSQEARGQEICERRTEQGALGPRSGAIDLVAERLLLTRAPSPIARGFAG